jgi:hypothetical protein
MNAIERVIERWRNTGTSIPIHSLLRGHADTVMAARKGCADELERLNREVIESGFEALRAVQKCELKHDEKGHAYLYVPARSIYDVAAIVSAALARWEDANALQSDDNKNG